jgi:transcriptional regulator with XRE-family HTH domain
MNLKEYLFYSGLTVRQFAKKAEMHDSYLSSILSGGRRPSKRMLKWIELATGGWVNAKDICSPTKLPDGFPKDISAALPSIPYPSSDEDDGDGKAA